MKIDYAMENNRAKHVSAVASLSLAAFAAGFALLAQSGYAVVFAQQSSGPTGSTLAERVMQLDRNSDGKVSSEEYPGPSFQQIDKDHDGFVTMDEVRAHYTARRTARPAAKQSAQPAATRPVSPVDDELQVVDAVFELCVRDVVECAKFYRDGIGMREVEPVDAEKGALLEWAGCYLRLRKVPGEKAAPAAGNPIKQMLASNGFRWFSRFLSRIRG